MALSSYHGGYLGLLVAVLVILGLQKLSPFRDSHQRMPNRTTTNIGERAEEMIQTLRDHLTMDTEPSMPYQRLSPISISDWTITVNRVLGSDNDQYDYDYDDDDEAYDSTARVYYDYVRETNLITQDDDPVNLPSTNDDPVEYDHDDPVRTEETTTIAPTETTTNWFRPPKMNFDKEPQTDMPPLITIDEEIMVTAPPTSNEESEDEDFDDDEETEDEDRPPNSIVAHLALGVVHNERLSRNEKIDVVGMALRTLTVVLNTYGEDSNGNGGLLFMVSDEDAFANVDDQRRNLEISSLPLAKLVLHNVTADPGEHEWWEVKAVYTVWKRPQLNKSKNTDSNLGYDVEDQDLSEIYKNPVHNKYILKKVEDLCDLVIDRSIAEGFYWEALQTIEFGDKHLILNEKPYYPHDKGLADVQDVGMAYDLKEYYCPNHQHHKREDPFHERDWHNGANRFRYNKTEDCDGCCQYNRDHDEKPYKDKDSERGDIPFGESGYGSSSGNHISSTTLGTYPDPLADSPLAIEWDLREWVGLGLMVGTLSLAIVVSILSHWVVRRKSKQQLWGAALTQEGVDDILQVGWRYHEQFYALSPQEQQQVQQQQQQQQENGEGSPQVFLQIYDKGKGPGYNDENSMLRGGVEQYQMANCPPLSTTAPTSATPPPRQKNDASEPPSTNDDS